MNFAIVIHVHGPQEQNLTRIAGVLGNADHALHYAANLQSPTFILAAGAAAKASKDKAAPIHEFYGALSEIKRGNGNIMVLPLPNVKRV